MSLLLVDCIFWGIDVYKQNYQIRFKTTQILIVKEKEWPNNGHWLKNKEFTGKNACIFFQFQEFTVLKPAHSLVASRSIVKAGGNFHPLLLMVQLLPLNRNNFLWIWSTSGGSTSAWRQRHDGKIQQRQRLCSRCVEELVPVNVCRSGHCFWLRSQGRVNVSVASPVQPRVLWILWMDVSPGLA